MRTSLNRQVWLLRLSFLRLAWKELLTVVASVGGAGVLLLVIPWGPESVRHVTAGVLFASAFWMVYAVTAMRTYNVTVGSWAEQWTREVLAHRALGWAVEDDLHLAGTNIDHVAVTQDEVLVVESKFRGLAHRPDSDRHLRDLRQAAIGARRVHHDLAARGLSDVRVTPVLVVWGPGAKDLPELPAAGAVVVLAGVELHTWCHRRSNKRLVSLTQRQDITRALGARRREHDEWRARQPAGQPARGPVREKQQRG